LLLCARHAPTMKPDSCWSASMRCRALEDSLPSRSIKPLHSSNNGGALECISMASQPYDRSTLQCPYTAELRRDRQRATGRMHGGDHGRSSAMTIHWATHKPTNTMRIIHTWPFKIGTIDGCSGTVNYVEVCVNNMMMCHSPQGLGQVEVCIRHC
jgi:hypothetical protein